MKMYVASLLSGIFILLTSPLNSTSLSLDSFIQTTLNNNPIAKLTTEKYLETIHTQQATHGIKDWNLFMTAYSVKGMENDFSIGFNPNTSSLQLETGLSKLFPTTGTHVQLDINRTIAKDLPDPFPGVTLPDLYKNSIDITIKQPLLKNAFGKIDRYPLKISEWTQTLAKLHYNEDIDDFIVQLTNHYLHWKRLYIQQNILVKQQEKATQQLATITQQYNQGAAENSDVIQLEQNLLGKSIQLEQINTTYTAQTYLIASMQQGQWVEKNPTITPSTSQNLIKIPTRAWALNYINSTSNIETLLQLTTTIQKATRDIYSNKKLPSLDLIAKQTLSNNTNSNAELNANLTKNSTFTIGFNASMPITNTTAKEQYLAAEHAYNKHIETAKHKRREIKQHIQSLYNELQSINTIISKQLRLVTLSKKYAELEEEKYNQGRHSSLFFVLSAQDKYLSTQLQLENLYIQRSLLQNQIASLTDTYSKSYLNGKKS